MTILPTEYSRTTQNNQRSCRHGLLQVPLCEQHSEIPLDKEQWTLIAGLVVMELMIYLSQIGLQHYTTTSESVAVRTALVHHFNN